MKLFLKTKRTRKDLSQVLKLMDKTGTYKKSLVFLSKFTNRARKDIIKFEGNKDTVYLKKLVDHLIIRDK